MMEIKNNEPDCVHTCKQYEFNGQSIAERCEGCGVYFGLLSIDNDLNQRQLEAIFKILAGLK